MNKIFNTLITFSIIGSLITSVTWLGALISAYFVKENED